MDVSGFTTLIIISAALLLVTLLTFERAGRRCPVLFLKTCLSALFVVTAATRRHPLPAYSYMVFAALSLDMIGDILLGLRRKRPFQVGVGFFLVGHVFYILAFTRLTPLSGFVNLSAVPAAVVITAVFVWLRPRLGSMLIPILLYMLVMGGMVVGAFAVFRTPGVPPAGQWGILVGTVAVFVSDIFVARQRFGAPDFRNRLLGLPLYYAGQYLMAFSVGLVG